MLGQNISRKSNYYCHCGRFLSWRLSCSANIFQLRTQALIKMYPLSCAHCGCSDNNTDKWWKNTKATRSALCLATMKPEYRRRTKQHGQIFSFECNGAAITLIYQYFAHGFFLSCGLCYAFSPMTSYCRPSRIDSIGTMSRGFWGLAECNRQTNIIRIEK